MDKTRVKKYEPNLIISYGRDETVEKKPNWPKIPSYRKNISDDTVYEKNYIVYWLGELKLFYFQFFGA